MMNYRIITAELHARTAVHIGSGEGADISDALIRRDAQGNPLIPGTAIAGVLRSLLIRLAPRLGSKVCVTLTGASDTCDCWVCQMMGAVNPKDDGEEKAAASNVLVFNARLKQESIQTVIRDGVGIDRQTRTAARAGHVKFDLEVLPPGMIFDLRLELRDNIALEHEQMLAAGLAEWQAGRLWLGGRVARGLGAFDLKNLTFKMHALDTTQGLLEYLQSDQPATIANPQPIWLSNHLGSIQLKPLQDSALKPFVARRWAQFEGILMAEGPLLANDTAKAGVEGFDHAPLLAQMGDLDKPVLSGAGLRGVLRSHAERIVRTLATFQAAGEDDFLTCCPACNPLENYEEAPLASCDVLLKKVVKSTDEVDDKHLCLACRLFGSTRRGSRLIMEDAIYDNVSAGGSPKYKMLDFLAIDRFTGGGAEKFKFDALVLWKPAFKFRMFLDNPEPWELGWLMLVLRDLQSGWLRVGLGASKGFGKVKLTELQCTMGYLTPEDLSDLSLTGIGKRETSIYSERTFTLQEAAPWLEEFRSKKVERGEGKLPGLRQDTYFGVQVGDKNLQDIYQLEVTL